jgi:hypothetical protein
MSAGEEGRGGTFFGDTADKRKDSGRRPQKQTPVKGFSQRRGKFSLGTKCGERAKRTALHGWDTAEFPVSAFSRRHRIFF